MAANDDHRVLVSEPTTSSPYPSNIGRPGIGTIPRTIPLYLNNGNGPRARYNHYTSHSVGSASPEYSPTKVEGEEVEDDLDQNQTYDNFTSLKQASSGTRYGVALTGGVGVHVTGSASSSPRKWGGSIPVCPRCMKNVYFAEQVCFVSCFL